MRKLLVVLVVLIALFLAADLFARKVAEDRIASRLQEAFELRSEPEVTIGGASFLVDAVHGRIPVIEMSGGTVASEDVTLEDVEVKIDDVTFSIGEVIDGRGRVRAGGGTGTATVTQRRLNQALRAAGATVTIVLGSDGVTVDGIDDAGAHLSLENGAIDVAAAGVPLASLDLPSLGGRISYDRLHAEEGRLRLSFAVQRLSLQAAGEVMARDVIALAQVETMSIVPLHP